MLRRTSVLFDILMLLLGCAAPSSPFGIQHLHTSRPVGRASSVTTDPAATSDAATALHLFGGLSDAFKNDETLGARQNEGLKNGPNYNNAVTVNGKAVQGAVVGQKLTLVASKVRVKIPVNCQKGDCGTCVVNLNGRKVKGTLLFVHPELLPDASSWMVCFVALIDARLRGDSRPVFFVIFYNSMPNKPSCGEGGYSNFVGRSL
jgi:ferredoxin